MDVEQVQFMTIKLKKDSSWYRHCKVRRKAKDDMCKQCPFRKYIEAKEWVWDHVGFDHLDWGELDNEKLKEE